MSSLKEHGVHSLSKELPLIRGRTRVYLCQLQYRRPRKSHGKEILEALLQRRNDPVQASRPCFHHHNNLKTCRSQLIVAFTETKPHLSMPNHNQTAAHGAIPYVPICYPGCGKTAPKKKRCSPGIQLGRAPQQQQHQTCRSQLTVAFAETNPHYA